MTNKNDVEEKQVNMKENNKKTVILNLTADLPRLSLQLINNLRGRFQIKFGMTPCVKGFTLIELLVVVLIIGILAAIALPMYNKAVEKTRWMEWVSVINGIEKETQLVFLEGLIPPLNNKACKEFQTFSGGTWKSSDEYAKAYFTYRVTGCGDDAEGDCADEGANGHCVYIDTHSKRDGLNVEVRIYQDGKKFITVVHPNDYTYGKVACDVLKRSYGAAVYGCGE